MSKQDRQGVRTAAELERKYNFGAMSSGKSIKTDQLAQTLAQYMAATNAKIAEVSFLSFMANMVISDHILVYRDRFDGTAQYPFVFTTEASNVLDMNREYEWMLAIGVGLCDADLNPLGIVIQGGVVVNNTTYGEHKPLTIDAAGKLSYASADADANELVKSGIVSAVCGYGPIIIDSVAVDCPSANGNMLVLGQFSNGDYAIISCEGTLATAQALCEGMKFAYCFAGGEVVLGQRRMSGTAKTTPTFIVFNGTSNIG